MTRDGQLCARAKDALAGEAKKPGLGMAEGYTAVTCHQAACIKHPDRGSAQEV